jgi:hypothetical protein
MREKRIMAGETVLREDIRTIARMAGLTLSEQQFEDLVAGYRLYEPVLARLPRDLPFSAEPAHVFDPRSFMPEGGSKK